jgi:hypothetical protein
VFLVAGQWADAPRLLAGRCSTLEVVRCAAKVSGPMHHATPTRIAPLERGYFFFASPCLLSGLIRLRPIMVGVQPKGRILYPHMRQWRQRI